jgi:surfeit locus 1 family protein
LLLISPIISLNFGSKTWQTSYVMLFLFVLILCVFLALCSWQLSRADEKKIIVALAEKKALQPAKLIDPSRLFENRDEEQWQEVVYSRNVVKGKWVAQYHYLQDNITYDGVAGFEVLTPFQAMDGTVFLVNRGWISKRHYSSKKVLVDSNEVQTFEGVWVLPTRRFTLSDTPYPQSFPKVVQEVFHQRIAKEINHPLVPLQFRLVKQSPSSSLSTLWEPVYGSPDKHYAYALQWFIFALILIFLFIKLNLRPTL